METIKFIIEDLALVLSILMIIHLGKRTLKFHQDSRYNYKDSLSYFKTFYTKHYYILLLIPFIFVMEKWFMQLVYIIFLVGIYIVARPKKQISKLVHTNRMIRIGVFAILFYTAIGTILMMSIEFNHLITLLAIYIMLSPILTIIASLIIYPLELMINKVYHYQANNKLKKFKPYNIGITGSSGKTSVKHYLYDILRNDRITFMSPKSYNTLNGLSMTVNKYLRVNNATMVLEMGATKVNDIDELLDFVTLDMAIVTQITSQHLKSFISLENIINEKMKVVERLSQSGIAILNYDCKEIRDYPIKNNCKVITIGTTADCDYYAKDIDMSLEGLSFTCVYQNNEFKVKSKLLGKYNINNILIAIASSITLGVNLNIITDAISSLEPVNHRLEVTRSNEITIIDDAYNSNPLGFKMALEVLSLAKDKKTIITPGIVDGGEATEAINYDIAIDIARVCDEVILINNPSSSFIHQGLINNGYENIHIVNNFASAKSLVTEGTVLIENDLPDNYFI